MRTHILKNAPFVQYLPLLTVQLSMLHLPQSLQRSCPFLYVFHIVNAQICCYSSDLIPFYDRLYPILAPESLLSVCMYGPHISICSETVQIQTLFSWHPLEDMCFCVARLAMFSWEMHLPRICHNHTHIYINPTKIYTLFIHSLRTVLCECAAAPVSLLPSVAV